MIELAMAVGQLTEVGDQVHDYCNSAWCYNHIKICEEYLVLLYLSI